MSLSQIIDKLHDMKIPSPGGSSRWSTGKLNDIIKSRFHLGKVYAGRFKSHTVEDVDDDGYTTTRRNVRLNDDKTEYVEYEGKHEAVKTEQEHAIIMDLMEKRGKHFRQRKKSGEKKRLQGLVRCPHCNRAMNIANMKNGVQYIQKCKGRSAVATDECKTETSGINENVLYSAIIATLRQRKDEIFSASESESNDKRLNSLYESLKQYETAIEKSKEKVERAKFMAVEGLIEMDEFKDIKNEAEYDIRNNTQEMRMLEKEAMVLDDVKAHRQKDRFQSDDVVKLLEGREDGMTSNDINEILRTIIRQVHYYKDKKNVRLEIEYL